MRLKALAGWLAAAAILTAVPAHAQIMSREADVVGLRLGQKVLVDDGSSPAGQIKQISGTKLAANGGIERSKACVDRKSAKR